MPDHMLRCDVCDLPVRPGKFYREITGWEELREGGGANKITLRTETGKVRCQPCMDFAKLRGQGSLL
jgi:hypothetical protein